MMCAFILVVGFEMVGMELFSVVNCPVGVVVVLCCKEWICAVKRGGYRLRKGGFFR